MFKASYQRKQRYSYYYSSVIYYTVIVYNFRFHDKWKIQSCGNFAFGDVCILFNFHSDGKIGWGAIM